MRIPGVASGMDAGRNLYNSFQMGFNPGAAKLPIFGAGRAGVSFGGLMTTGGFAAIGAGIGAVATSQIEGANIGTGAAIGAAAGFAALPMMGVAARGVPAAGQAAYQGMAALGGALPGMAVGGVKMASGFIGGVNRMSPAVGEGLMGRIGSSLASPVRRHVQALGGIGSSMINFDSEASNLSKVKLTGIRSGAAAGWNAGKSLPGKIAGGAAGGLFNGKNLLWGAAGVMAAASAFNEYNRVHMGQMDGQVTRMTPRTPYYEQNAGATGDLVFALNANRRG